MLKKLLYYIGLGAFVLGITALIISRGWFSGIQRGLQNNFYDFASASTEIVIVGIDEKSLQAGRLGPLQEWPRAHYANALRVLNEAGAAVVGIDITFPDLSTKGSEDDQLFRNALEAYPNTVLAARYYFENGQQYAEWPNDVLTEARPQTGWINVNLDPDGFIRKIPLFEAVRNDVTEAFSLKIAREYLNAEPEGYQVVNGGFQFDRDTRIPTVSLRDSRNNRTSHFMYVNYFAEPNSFTTMSMADLLEGEFVNKAGEPITVSDKIVLIGPTAIDLQDYYLSPVSKGVRMAGVEVHANAIQTLITKQFLRDQSRMSLWLTLAGLIVFNLLIFSALRVRWAVPLALLELFGLLVAGIVAYEFRIFLNVIYPILVVLLSFIGAFLLRYFLEHKEKQFIEGAFGHYVNKSVVDQIMKNPDMLELGGAKREVTAFFSDIEGFTALSEKMEPAELVKFLNRYLDEMTKVILEREGTLDKYEGDAIMAFWGAPNTPENPALNACLAALENQAKLAELDAQWKNEGLPEIRARIGINTGEAIVGNMGSVERFDYTIVGDNVNLASRLEGINKQYGTQIIISDSTHNQVKEALVCRELDIIRVKGKEEAVRIYELAGTKESVTPDKLQAIDAFQQALEQYRAKNFMAAKAAFEKLAGDPAASVFARRCESFMKTPPTAEWDGVWSFEVK